MYTYALIADDSLTDTQAHQCHDDACDFLQRHKLVPTPQNYLLAYEFARAGNKTLVDAVESHQARGFDLAEADAGSLFDTFLSVQTSESGDSLMQEAFRVLMETVRKLDEAEAGLGEFSDELSAQNERLNQTNPSADIYSIVRALSDATERAQSNNQHLQEDLVNVQQEAEELRQEIERLRKESQTDALTGLSNRKALEEMLLRMRSRVGEEQYSVLMMDIDHFKSINDTFGHPLGDQVIRKIGETIKKTIRGSDVAVRYGGEEYLLILPDTPPEGAAIVGESIRSAVEKLRLVERHSSRRMPRFTVSVGIAWNHGQEVCDAVIARADRALYQSKQQGRNRCTDEASLCDDKAASG